MRCDAVVFITLHEGMSRLRLTEESSLAVSFTHSAWQRSKDLLHPKRTSYLNANYADVAKQKFQNLSQINNKENWGSSGA